MGGSEPNISSGCFHTDISTDGSQQRVPCLARLQYSNHSLIVTFDRDCFGCPLFSLSSTSELYEHDSKEQHMMVIHSQRSSQLIHTDNMRWRLALKNTETWEFQCCETRKFQIELTQIFIFFKMACCQLDCRI